MSDGRRPRRVADAVRASLSLALAQGMGDPRLGEVVITEVTVSPDLSLAQVRVRRLAGTADGRQVRALLEALAGAAPRLRRHLAAAVDLKRVPTLRFHYDEGADAARRVEELLREVAAEARGRGRHDAGTGE